MTGTFAAGDHSGILTTDLPETPGGRSISASGRTATVPA